MENVEQGPDWEALFAQSQLEKQELLAALQQPYADSAAYMHAAIDALPQRMAHDVVALASRLASAVLGKAIELDSKMAVTSLERALRAGGSFQKISLF